MGESDLNRSVAELRKKVEALSSISKFSPAFPAAALASVGAAVSSVELLAERVGDIESRLIGAGL